MVIYQITNTANGKIYVGKYEGKRPLKTYFRRQISNAAVGSSDKPYLYNAIRKYGSEAFRIEILSTADTHDDLCEAEKRHIAIRQSCNPEIGYNISAGGDGNSSRPSEATLEKLRTSHLGYRATVETRQRLSEALREAYRNGRATGMRGKRHSAEARRRIGKANEGNRHGQGYRHTEDAKRRIGEATRRNHTGKVVPEETRQKISAALTGRSPGRTGQSLTPEHRQKLVDAWVRRRARAEESPHVFG